MGGRRIYLDYNATAPVRPAARAAALAAMECGGNASSVHAEGRKARAMVEDARRAVAALVGASPEQVTFVSGGTEAANTALCPTEAAGRPVQRLLLGATEHAAMRAGHRFAATEMATVPVDTDGVIDLGALADHVAAADGPVMLGLQAANNETGVIQPIAEASRIIRERGGIVVCDAVQAVGRIAFDAAALRADVLLISAHKLGGIPGAGAIVLLRDDVRVPPLLRGGGQERGARGGTETLPAIAAFGAAAGDIRIDSEGKRMTALRDRFEAGLRALAPDAVIFGERVARLPNTSAFAVPGVPAERLLMALDLGGVAVSSGSACSSGVVGRSHVLEAMGVGHDLRMGAIRVSLGWGTTRADIDDILAVLAPALDRMRRSFRPAA